MPPDVVTRPQEEAPAGRSWVPCCPFGCTDLEVSLPAWWHVTAGAIGADGLPRYLELHLDGLPSSVDFEATGDVYCACDDCAASPDHGGGHLGSPRGWEWWKLQEDTKPAAGFGAYNRAAARQRLTEADARAIEAQDGIHHAQGHEGSSPGDPLDVARRLVTDARKLLRQAGRQLRKEEPPT